MNPRRNRGPLRKSHLDDEETATLRQAKGLWAKGDFDRALRSFDEAVRLAPSNVRVLADSARAYGRRYDVERAADYVQQLLKLAPDNPAAIHAAAETYRMMGWIREAIDCFESASSQKNSEASRLELASLYERGHRLDEALGLIQSVLATHPQIARAWLLKGRVERRMRLYDASDNSLQQLLRLTPLAPDVFAEGWAELAQLRDELGDYAGAWQAIGVAKQSQIAREASERAAAEHVLRRFAGMVDQLSTSHFERWSKPGAAWQPHRLALLTGFPRSGTTLLEQVLDSHPGVVSLEETNVFSQDVITDLGKGKPADFPVDKLLDELSDKSIAAARTYYFRVMTALARRSLEGKLLLDKNPAMNLMIPVVLRLFPECRLLVALRDPRDVVLSCYLRYLPLNPVSVSFLTPERTAQRYSLDLLGWLKFREIVSTAWGEFRYEKTVADLPATARRAIQLLGLQWDDQVLNYRQRLKDKPVLSPTYEAVTRPIYSSAIGRWRHYAEQLEPVMAMLEPYVREFGYEV